MPRITKETSKETAPVGNLPDLSAARLKALEDMRAFARTCPQPDLAYYPDDNGKFLSVKDLVKLAEKRKPVGLHALDMWGKMRTREKRMEG